MSSRTIHVAREGRVLGQYPLEQVASLYETGHFVVTDMCYSDAVPEWLPIEEFLQRANPPRFQRGRAMEEEAPRPAPERRSSRRAGRKPAMGSGLSGWILSLFLVAALVGSIFWIMSLHEEILTARADVQKAEAKLAEKEKEYQKMLFVAQEMAESGTVRGSAVLRDGAGKRVAIPGLTVFLLPRETVEKYLDERFEFAAKLPPNTEVNPSKFLLENLPSPTAQTTTDSSGRYEFKIPTPGEYVLVASLEDPSASRVWFVAFNSEDPLNTKVDLNDLNSVQQLVRSLMIVEGR